MKAIKKEIMKLQSDYLKIRDLYVQYKEINKFARIVKLFHKIDNFGNIISTGFTFNCSITSDAIDFGSFYIDFDYIKLRRYQRMLVRGGKLIGIIYDARHFNIYKVRNGNKLTLCLGGNIEGLVNNLVFVRKNIVSGVTLIIDMLLSAKINDGLTIDAFPIKRCRICDDVIRECKKKDTRCISCRKQGLC